MMNEMTRSLILGMDDVIKVVKGFLPSIEVGLYLLFKVGCINMDWVYDDLGCALELHG